MNENGDLWTQHEHNTIPSSISTQKWPREMCSGDRACEKPNTLININPKSAMRNVFWSPNMLTKNAPQPKPTNATSMVFCVSDMRNTQYSARANNEEQGRRTRNEERGRATRTRNEKRGRGTRTRKKNEEQGTRSRNEEQGTKTRNEERGTRNEEGGVRNEERGTRTRNEE